MYQSSKHFIHIPCFLNMQYISSTLYFLLIFFSCAFIFFLSSFYTLPLHRIAIDYHHHNNKSFKQQHNNFISGSITNNHHLSTQNLVTTKAFLFLTRHQKQKNQIAAPAPPCLGGPRSLHYIKLHSNRLISRAPSQLHTQLITIHQINICPHQQECPLRQIGQQQHQRQIP